MLEKSDHIIMLAVKEGNTEQLAQLFERHHLKLYNFLLQLCGNRQWSEDMVQESFIRMLKYASSYSHDGCFLPWAFKIARSVAAQYLGKMRNEKLKLSPDTTIEPDETEAFFSDPDYLQEMSEKKKKLQLALLKLPPEKRELILLSKLNLLNMTELALLFDCSVNVVKVRLHRAIGTFREVYAQECEEKQ